MLFPRLRRDREEEEVGEVDNRRVPTVQGNVHQGHLFRNGNAILEFVPWECGVKIKDLYSSKFFRSSQSNSIEMNGYE